MCLAGSRPGQRLALHYCGDDAGRLKHRATRWGWSNRIIMHHANQTRTPALTSAPRPTGTPHNHSQFQTSRHRSAPFIHLLTADFDSNFGLSVKRSLNESSAHADFTQTLPFKSTEHLLKQTKSTLHCTPAVYPVTADQRVRPN